MSTVRCSQLCCSEAEPVAVVNAVQDLEAYLTGASDASEYIQLAVPELVLPELPLHAVCSPAVVL